jgi:hypothetical protein
MNQRFGREWKSSAIRGSEPKFHLGRVGATISGELTLQKSEIWRFSGLLEEYVGAPVVPPTL